MTPVVKNRGSPIGVLHAVQAVAGPNEHVTQSQPGRLEDLFLRHAGAAGRLAYLLTGDRELADDLVQDAFVHLAGRFAHLRDPEAFPAYHRPSPLSPTGMKPIGWQPRCYAFRSASGRPSSFVSTPTCPSSRQLRPWDAAREP